MLVGKEEVKLSLLTDGTILYFKKKTLQITHTHTHKYVRTNKLIQQSCRIQNKNRKLGCFLYTDKEPSEKKIKKKILFTIALKRIKYLWINLTKEVKDLYTDNCKVLLKEIKDTNKWKLILCHGFKDDIVKMSVLPKWSTSSLQSLWKSLKLFSEIENSILKFMWNFERL